MNAMRSVHRLNPMTMTIWGTVNESGINFCTKPICCYGNLRSIFHRLRGKKRLISRTD